MTFSKTLLIATIVAGSVACANNTAVAPPPLRPVYSTVVSPGRPDIGMSGHSTSGFDVANIDRSVSACKDFLPVRQRRMGLEEPDPSCLLEMGKLQHPCREKPDHHAHDPRGGSGIQGAEGFPGAEAIDKLEKYATKIGYPDKWIDYAALDLARDVYARNAAMAAQFLVRRDLGKIGKPLDRTVWGMSPPTVNAYNNSQLNEIVFPAGILQPPFYDPNADEAYNYGGMGAVIGHELIHGFDDEGSKFDAQGNLSNWWSEEDRKKFEARAKCVSQQFSGFEVGNDLKMNGELVLGESIADLGGLAIAHAAYQRSLEGKPRQTIDGFTPEQRFFLGWAQVWATNATPEYERLQVTTDPHPLARFRVNGPLSNMPEFAEAFGCNRGEAMVRAETERCDIW